MEEGRKGQECGEGSRKEGGVRRQEGGGTGEEGGCRINLEVVDGKVETSLCQDISHLHQKTHTDAGEREAEERRERGEGEESRDVDI